MKKLFLILTAVLISVMLMTSACSNAGTSAPTSPSAAEQTQAPAQETAAPEDDPTDAPEIATEAEKDTEGTEEDATPDDPVKAELVNNKWGLTDVIDADGKSYSAAHYYGSLIRQTGAYLQFNEDDTFQCVMGGVGCSGTYSVQNGTVQVHITRSYNARSEEEDVDETTTLSRNDDTIQFDFNKVTNIFTKKLQ